MPTAYPRSISNFPYHNTGKTRAKAQSQINMLTASARRELHFRLAESGEKPVKTLCQRQVLIIIGGKWIIILILPFHSTTEHLPDDDEPEEI